MPIRTFAGLALATAAGLCLTLSAEANPRFTVENASDDKIEIYIYNGDDTQCITEAKTKKISPGETESYGCTGNGKGKCKVKFFYTIDQICRSNRNTCNGKAIKLDGGSKVKISSDNDTFVCDID